MMYLACSKCHVRLPESEFYKDNTKARGYRYRCKKCMAEGKKEYRNRPEVKRHAKEHAKKYRNRPEVKQHIKEMRNKPGAKQQRKEYAKEYCNRPGQQQYYKKCRRNQQNIIDNLKINGCAICGFNEYNYMLHFHHVNSKDKKYGISQTRTARPDFIDELQKCILLCSSCHIKIHSNSR